MEGEVLPSPSNVNKSLLDQSEESDTVLPSLSKETAMSGKRTKIRGGHKAYVNKLLTQVVQLLEDKESFDEMNFQTLRECLKRKSKIIADLDNIILEELEDDEKIADEIEESDEFQNRIRLHILQIDQRIGTETKNAIVSSESKDEKFRAKRKTEAYVKLPKLDIAKFYGDPKDYTRFQESFDIAIGNNEDLSDVQKLNYLKGFLASEAEKAIRGLPLTNANYTNARQILEERFGSRQMIIESHMKSLLKLTAVNSIADTKGIRALYDQIESNLRSLEAIDIDKEMYGCLLIPLLKEKLPKELNLIVSRCFDSNYETWNIGDMLEALRKEIEARERCEMPANKKPGETQRRNTTESFHTRNKNKKSKDKGKSEIKRVCVFCGQDHFSDKCTVVTNIEARKAIVRDEGRCYKCLRKNHKIEECRDRKNCFRCNGKHHTSICEPRNENENENEENSGGGTPITQASLSHLKKDKVILLESASAFIHNPKESDKQIGCKVLFDNGSQRTYITTRSKNKLKLKSIDKENLEIHTFGGYKHSSNEHDVVKLTLSGRDSDIRIPLEAVVVENISSEREPQPINDVAKQYSHLKNLKLADGWLNENNETSFELLIGLDYYWKVMTGDVIRGEEGPVALASRIGYILSGPSKGNFKGHKNEKITSNQLTFSFRIQSEQKENRLEDAISKFWSVESLGVEEPQTIMELTQGTIKHNGERYEVSLPWRENHPVLSDNYFQSKVRLNSLLKKLQKDPEMMKNYKEVIDDQIEKGIVEKVDTKETPGVGKTFYLPHHVVVRSDKATTKHRVVFDGSSKTNGISLNDCLHTGPALHTDLFAVLVRFRTRKIAIVSDIEKAFLNVGIDSTDRDVLRFLWYDKIESEKRELRMYRFTRVCFGINSSMFLLGVVIKNHLDIHRDSDEKLVEKIENSLYVDDVNAGVDNVKEGEKFYKDSKQLFKGAGLNLRKWVSNSAELQEVIDDYEETMNKEKEEGKKKSADETANETKETKVLGIPWNVRNDELKFNLRELVAGKKVETVTKRDVLSITASIYDPLGFLSPCVVILKVLFQRLCQEKSDWDDILSGELKNDWDRWCRSAAIAGEVKISRYYFRCPGEIKSVELVGFSDASEKAYAAVVYARAEIEGEDEYQTSLIGSKTRVAPIKTQTMPRLELLGALILARLIRRICETISSEYSINEVTCCTDSAIAFSWVQHSDLEYKKFVQGKVVEIRKKTELKQWKHVPGKENIADLPTRGCLPDELAENQQWLEGPDWLKKPKDEWPLKSWPLETKEHKEEIESELKKNKPEVKECVMMTMSNQRNIEDTISPKSYGCIKKLIRVTAWILRFIERMKQRIKESEKDKDKENEKDEREELDNAELERARKKWIKHAQSEIAESKNFKQMQVSLAIYKDDDDLLRCGGRLQRSKLPKTAINPLILPNKHRITELLIEEAHEAVFHNGVKETLTEVRSRYWIVKGRQAVNRSRRRCLLCKRMEGVCFGQPGSAPLPRSRVVGDRAFRTTGIDYCGPVYIKISEKSDSEKAYIALMTCATSRMLHLELTPDLGADALIRCLKRFTSRRGKPTQFISDNAKTFKSKKLKGYIANFATYVTRWKYNLAKAPWWDGLYERMVRSVKRCLKKMLRFSLLTYEELITVLAEVEAVISSRPLTYVSEGDIDEPLTLSHFCYVRRLLSPDIEDQEENLEPTRKDLISKTLDAFWKRWISEYLLDLRSVHKQQRQSGLRT